MFSGKGDCAHVRAGGAVVSSGGSSLASGKCSDIMLDSTCLPIVKSIPLVSS